MKKNRDELLDIAKGIGILLIVLGHSNCPYKPFLVLFYVPIFFMISAIFLKESSYANISNVGTYIVKKIKGLWLPFFICNVIFLLCNNFFIDHNLYTTNELFLSGNHGNNWGLDNFLTVGVMVKKIFYLFLFSSGTKLGGPTWFLRVLFWVSISYCFINYFLSKIFSSKLTTEVIKAFLYICACCIGSYFYHIDFVFYSINVMFSVIILYHLGTYYRLLKQYLNFDYKLGIISFLVLLYILNVYSGSIYANPLILIISSVSGLFLVLSISNYIKKSLILSKIFNYFGQHTIPILCMHIISFKVITYAQILYYKNIPIYRLASFPCYITEHGWWCLYTICGMILPLIAYEIYKILKNKIKTKFNAERV